MARSSLKEPVWWDGAIISHCRYPTGMVTPKIGEAPFAFTLSEANGIAAKTCGAIKAAHIQT
jgi:hypothetical protein